MANVDKSMSDCAYTFLQKKKKAKSFYEIWDSVVEELNLDLENQPDDIISYFYTNLTLDSRFVNVGDNKWDLRERLPFEKVHIDMNDIYNDDEEGYEELTSSDSEDEENADEDYDDYDSEKDDEDDAGRRWWRHGPDDGRNGRPQTDVSAFF